MPGLRVQRLAEEDSAGLEWDLTVDPACVAAVVARPAAGRRQRRGYEFVLTFARRLAVRAANALLMRLAEPELADRTQVEAAGG